MRCSSSFGVVLEYACYLAPVLIAGLVSAGCSAQLRISFQAEQLAQLHMIAVLPFEDAPGADAGRSGSVVSNAIVRECLSVPQWTVVERDRVTDILVEQDLGKTGVVDAETAVQMGKLLVANGVVFGSVNEYRISSIPFIFMFTLDQDVYKVGFSLRLVSVQTGKVCFAASASGTSVVSFQDAISKCSTQVFDKLRSALGSDTGATNINDGEQQDEPDS